MKLRQIILASLAVFVLNFISQVAWSSGFDSLTPAQKQMIQRGERVQVFTEFSNEPWPGCQIFDVIKSTPEEAAAVFADYNEQFKYIYRMERSDVIQQINRSTYIIEYELSIPWYAKPFISIPIYQVKSQIVKDPGGFPKGTYQIDWTLVSSKTVDRLNGSVVFEPLGNETMISYYSFMAPTFSGASFGPVVSGVKRGSGKALTSIMNQILEIRASQPDALKAKIESLRKQFLDLL